MLKLLKMDMKLTLNDRNNYLRGMLLLFIVYGFSVEIDIMDFVLLQLPIIISIFTSFESNVNEFISRRHLLIQSLPLKRWETVASKYVLVMIKFVLLILYMVLVLSLLRVLGFDSFEYIYIIYMRETLTMWILTLATIIPIMFMHFGTGRTFFTIFVTNISTRMYLDGMEGIGGFDFLFSMDNIKLLSIVIIGMAVSIWVSLFIYSKRDLG